MKGKGEEAAAEPELIWARAAKPREDLILRREESE